MGNKEGKSNKPKKKITEDAEAANEVRSNIRKQERERVGEREGAENAHNPDTLEQLLGNG